MEKCKFCQADLDEGVTLCPVCGKDNGEEVPAETVSAEEAPAQEKTEITPGVTSVTPGKLALAIAAVVVLLAVLIALVMMGLNNNAAAEETVPSDTAAAETVETVPPTVPADGEKGTVTEKGTYTASDADVLAAKDAVVASIGDKTLTNSQLQVYYWLSVHEFLNSNYYYLSYYGLDYALPLDVQTMDPVLHGQDHSMTWQQYFLDFALNSWHQIQAMALEAEAAGVEISEEDQQTLDTLEADLTESAAGYGVTLEAYLLQNIGPGAGMEDFKHYQKTYMQGAPYYNDEISKLVPTEEDLDAYFTEHEEEYADGGITRDSKLVNVRHILLTPQGDTEDATTFTDEQWAACEAEAQAILDGWKAGEATEESFAALANEHSTDPGSNTKGGLYEDVTEGEMVQEFNDWCFDASRQHGDTGLVKTTYGYHIMFFVSSEPDLWKEYAKSDWITEKSNQLLESNLEKHPMEVHYDQILLGALPEA